MSKNDDTRRQNARKQLRRELRSVIRALEHLRPELETISTKVKVEFFAADKCGEKNTSLSTCTKINTTTDPCDKTKTLADAKPPVISVDLDELVSMIAQGNPDEPATDEEGLTYSATVLINFQTLMPNQTSKQGTDLFPLSLDLGPGQDHLTELITDIRNEAKEE